MNIAAHIEHTALAPTLTQSDIDKLVAEAKQFHFFGVCVPPFWVKSTKREIGNSPITLVTVAGFPLGYSMTETKLEEIKQTIENGADEVDMVWNLSSFKSNNPWVKVDIAKCAKLTHDHQKILKVIIETAYLSDGEITEACKICVDAGTDFVKTSTGFVMPISSGDGKGARPTGATIENIKLMRSILPSSVRIKASGGIKTFEQAVELVKAGADRIGTSSGVAIINQQLIKGQ